MAPEVLERAAYSPACDMWAVGVILFIMLAGCHPFDQGGDADDDSMMESIYEAEPHFGESEWKNISPSAVRMQLALSWPEGHAACGW